MTHLDVHASNRFEVLRYILNGLVATAVHFSVLTFALLILEMPSAGAANFLAAIFGIATSFFGNRYFVFRSIAQSILQQAIRFLPLYAGLAIMNGALLFVWTDLFSFDYRLGFLIALGLQVIIGYIANKQLVFL